MENLIKEYEVDGNKEAVELIRLIAYTKESVFLTGKAGTGKSTLLNKLIQHTRKSYIILAPTGIAALNVNGQTIQSFFRFEPRPYLPNDSDITYLPNQIEIIKKLDLVIIDEISMVRADLMNAIDLSLRKHIGIAAPFGGKQLLLIGDLFQLPPVLDSKDPKVVEIINSNYKSTYFFSASAFESNFNYQTIELEKVYRQKDASFISLLNGVRENVLKPEHLDYLNGRYAPNYIPRETDLPIILATTKAIVASTNTSKLAALESKLFEYKANVTGKFVNETSENKLPAERVLSLKIGAQVMFVKNDASKRWVNGSIGKVTSLGVSEVKVELKDGIQVNVERVVWESYEYVWNKKENKIDKVVTGTFEQFPIQLAWAVTIHKSQGQSFDKVIIDLGNGAFANGQTYVALSRCRSFEGITLKTLVKISDIKVDNKVKEFLASRRNMKSVQHKAESIANGMQDVISVYDSSKNTFATRVKQLESEIASLQRNVASLTSLLYDENTIVKRLNSEVKTLNAEKAGLNKSLSTYKIVSFFTIMALLAALFKAFSS